MQFAMKDVVGVLFRQVHELVAPAFAELEKRADKADRRLESAAELLADLDARIEALEKGQPR